MTRKRKKFHPYGRLFTGMQISCGKPWQQCEPCRIAGRNSQRPIERNLKKTDPVTAVETETKTSGAPSTLRFAHKESAPMPFVGAGHRSGNPPTAPHRAYIFLTLQAGRTRTNVHKKSKYSSLHVHKRTGLLPTILYIYCLM